MDGFLPGLKGPKLDLLLIIGLCTIGEVGGVLFSMPTLALTLSPIAILLKFSAGKVTPPSDGP